MRAGHSRLGRPRYGDARLAQAHCTSPEQSKPDPGLLAAEDVGHAQLGHGGLHGGHAAAPALTRIRRRPDARRRPGWPRSSRRHRSTNRRLLAATVAAVAAAAAACCCAARAGAPPPPPRLPAGPPGWPPARPPGPADPAPGSASPWSPPPPARWPARATSPAPPPIWACAASGCCAASGSASASRTLQRRFVLGQIADDLVRCTGCVPGSGSPTRRSRRRTRSRACRTRRPRPRHSRRAACRRSTAARVVDEVGVDGLQLRSPRSASLLCACCTCRRGWRSAAPPGPASPRSGSPATAWR